MGSIALVTQRLVAVTGVISLLNVLSVFRHLRKSQTFRYSTVLVVDVSGTDLKNRASTMRVIRTIAESSGQFDNIVRLSSELEDRRGMLKSYTAQLRRQVSSCPEFIYIVRNWQPLNEAILDVYAGAKIVAVGDSFGLLDLRRPIDWPPAYRLRGYRRVHATFSILNYPETVAAKEKSLRLSKSHTEVSPIHLLVELNQAAAAVSKDIDMQSVQANNDGGALALLSSPQHLDGPIQRGAVLHRALLSLGQRLAIQREAAVRRAAIAGERSTVLQAQAYIDAIRGGIPTTQHVILKPHPRGVPRLTRLVADGLTGHGYDVTVLDGIAAALPVEVILLADSFRHLDSVLTLGSHSIHSLEQLRIGPARIQSGL